MEEGIVRDDIPGSRNLGSRDYWAGVRGLRGPVLEQLRAWVEDRRQRQRRTGQAQKERGPGFVGTQ